MAVKLPSIEHIRHLYVQQRKGRSKAARTRARNELLEITRNLQKTANSRLRTLRQSDYAYGSVYDTTENYLEQKGKQYFTLPTEAKRGRINPQTGEKYPLSNETYAYTLRLQSFVASKETTITGQREIEKKRFETYRQNFPFARDMSDGELRNFLRFLGNSGVHEYLDYFGEASGDEVEELADIYARANMDEVQKLNFLFDEFAQYEKAAKQVEAGTINKIPDFLSNYNFSSLRKELSNLYESIEKRTR